MQFQIGDRVRCIHDSPALNDEIDVGDTGVVCNIMRYTPPQIGVYWDRKLERKGHGCHGTCPDKHGWYVRVSDIELISEAGSDVDIPEVDTDAMNALFLEVV